MINADGVSKRLPFLQTLEVGIGMSTLDPCPHTNSDRDSTRIHWLRKKEILGDVFSSLL